MFKELESLINERPVVISLKMVDDKVSIMVAPQKQGESENPAYWVPFVAIDTAENLDAALPDVLRNYCVTRAAVTQSLKDSLAQVEAQIKAASDAAKKAAASKLKKPGKPSTTGTYVPPATANGSLNDDDEGGDDNPREAEIPQASLF